MSTREYVIADLVSGEYLVAAVWYTDMVNPWSPDIHKARRFKHPQPCKVEQMTEEHEKFLNHPDYDWIREDGRIPEVVDFRCLPVDVTVTPVPVDPNDHTDATR